MTRVERELLRILREAHHRLDCRGITRYPKPYLEEQHGDQPERTAGLDTEPTRAT